MHSMYAGYMEKAVKYSEKALIQVERLKGEHHFECYFKFTVYMCYCCCIV